MNPGFSRPSGVLVTDWRMRDETSILCYIFDVLACGPLVSSPYFHENAGAKNRYGGDQPDQPPA